MSKLQNPIRGPLQGRIGGLLAAAIGFGGEGRASAIGVAMTRASLVIVAVLFGIDEYLDIGTKNQTLEAARFNSQEVLVENHLTPEQAAIKLAAGVVINGLDGKPIVGKSLEAFSTDVIAQGKGAAEIVAAQYEAYKTCIVDTADITGQIQVGNTDPCIHVKPPTFHK
jgi:hypothetical protein